LRELANKHFEMKLEIHFEFRASLRKFQDLNFWDATKRPHAFRRNGCTVAHPRR
jgi:hypothetical protein